jgi:site-specific recombinase XerD
MTIEKNLIQLSNAMQLRNFTKATKKSYLYHVSKFLFWIESNNVKINESSLERYFLEFSKCADSNTVKLRKSAIFFYLYSVLKLSKIDVSLPFVKSKKKLPNVISREEVKILLSTIKNNKHKLMIQLLYSSGIRVSELVFLKKECLNLHENTPRVERGKGRKDRIAIISNTVKKELLFYLTHTTFTTQYLFETNIY